MKLLVKEYQFVPSERMIHLTDDFEDKHPNVITESFLLVTNLTTGDVIYQFNDPTKGGEFVHNTLTLTYETSGMSATDLLQIFVDVPPAFHVQGNDGSFRGGDYNAPMYVVMEDMQGTFRQILKELKKMNLHLESMTDMNLTNRDLDGDI